MTLYSRGEETRSTILHTALELFSQNGYDATSVAEICQRAGTSKGAFYHHFPSKQDLFLSLMETWLDEIDGMFQSAGAAAEDIPQALENMAGFSGGIFDALEGGFPILLEFWTQSSRQPAFWEKAVEPYRKYLAFFAEMIDTGKKEGAFAEGIDSQLAARIVMAVAMGLMLQATFDPASAEWQEVTRSGIKILMKGMRSKA
jgi:AcrR family transcriptional regulator